MVKAKSENNTNNSGTMLTAADGTQYFVMGKIRIKVSEHFAENGKPLNSLLEDVIQHAGGVLDGVVADHQAAGLAGDQP